PDRLLAARPRRSGGRRVEDQERARRRRDHRARGVPDLRLREAHARAGLDHAALRGQRAAVPAHGLEVADLDLDRRVALARRQHGLDRAAAHRVQQGAQHAAVDGADRVVARLVGRAREADAALLDVDDVEPEVGGDGRGRDLAVAHPAEELDAGHPRRLCGELQGVVPGQLAGARIAPALGAALRLRGRRGGGLLCVGHGGKGSVRHMQAADLPLVRSVSRPAVHPDGTWAVVSVTRPDLDADAVVGQLWRVPLTGEGDPRRLTRGFRDTEPRFSPDGGLVAFLRAEPQAAPQLWVLPVAGGEAVQVTDRALGVSGFRWSPDGTRLAFLSREPEQGRYGTVEGIAPAAEGPRRITGWSWTRNGLGYHRDRPQHAFVVDVPDVAAEPVVQPAPTPAGPAEPRPAVAEPRRVTTDDVDHTDLAFTPDGTALGVIAEREPGQGQAFSGVVRVLPLTGSSGGASDVDLGTLSPQAVAFGAGGELYVVAQDLGPEGKDFVARNAALYVLSAWADPAPRRLTDPETQGVGGSPVVLPDG